MKLKRKRLRRNLRSLHPIPYLVRKQQQEWNDVYDHHMRKAMTRMIQHHVPPKRWLKYVMIVTVVVTVVAGYVSGSHNRQQYDTKQTRL